MSRRGSLDEIYGWSLKRLVHVHVAMDIEEYERKAQEDGDGI